MAVAQDTQPPLAPFVIRPLRISNYTQLIAQLRVIRARHRDIHPRAAPSLPAVVLGRQRESFSLDRVVEGHLHQCVAAHFDRYARGVLRASAETVARRIRELRRDNDRAIYSFKIGSLRGAEEALFNRPTKYTVKDELLLDLWQMLHERRAPMDFLHAAYLKHICMLVQAPGDGATGATSVDDGALREMVTEFVRRRFNRDEYALESYEGRYLWAELFVLYRLGREALVRELLGRYEVFFEFMAQKFRTAFTEYLDGRVGAGLPPLARSDDRFKRFLFELVDGRACSDGAVIATAEDYLWLKLVTGAPRVDAEQFASPKARFMAQLLTGQYGNAVDTLLRSDFGLVPKFFLLREICLEKQLDAEERGVAAAEDRGSLRAVDSVFFSFFFTIATQLSTREHRVRFIEMLKPYPGYHDVVPGYIIKHGLLDLLCPQEAAGAVEYALDTGLSERVVAELRRTGDRARLARLHHMVPAEAMGPLLEELLTDAIVAGDELDEALINSHAGRLAAQDSARVQALYGLYLFARAPSMATLRASVLCDVNARLEPFTRVIERVFPKAVDVVRTARDSELAQCLFQMSGALALNEACCQKAATDLVALI